tara:strand:- start:3721 stop:5898 length:2178 start_codon:yes stop_codon:yes gene_type:complete
MSVELNNITSGYSTGLINDNFQLVEDELNNNVLRRDGLSSGEANHMEVGLDMNSNFVYNLPEPVLEHQAARLQDVQNAIQGNSSANLITFTPYGSISSGNVQSALQELEEEGNQRDSDISQLQTDVTSIEDTLSSNIYALNVKDFGAVGDGVTDDGPSVRSAIEALVEGQTLYFPPGHYFTAYADHTVLSNWILIQESGCTLTASPGTVTLENFLIAVSGSFDTPINVGASGFTSGDEVISTASAHGLSQGDVVQFLSQINSYSTDAGSFQLGSRNPTNNTLPEFRFSEIHKVQEVIDSTSFRIDSVVIYADYADNTVGLNDPMAGVTSAQIRKINAVHDTLFYGLIFTNVDNDNFRELYASGAYNVSYEKCGFITEGRPGRHLRTQNSYGIRLKECWERRAPVGASGSSWNSFVIAGGSQNAFFFDCDFKGGQQCIDFTPSANNLDPFYLSDDLGGTTVQVVGVNNCKMEDCSDAATSHPGTYICFFHGNQCTNVRTGFRGRSRNMSIQNNMIKANDVGVELSAFYEDTLISGNNFTQAQIAAYGSPAGGWSGVSIVPMSSETMNNNDVKNVAIRENTFVSFTSDSGDMGVQLRHVSNGVPPSGLFTEFTDAIKTNLSSYDVSANKFYRCGVQVNSFINGVNCMRNNFDEGGNLAAYFESVADSARHRVGLNMFDGGQPTNTIVTKAPATLTYGYNTAHRVSNNLYAIGVANNSLADSAAFSTD